jgi:hypothetical protein
MKGDVNLAGVMIGKGGGKDGIQKINPLFFVSS